MLTSAGPRHQHVQSLRGGDRFLQTPSCSTDAQQSVYAKTSYSMRKFEGLLCGPKDAIIYPVLLGTAASIVASARRHAAAPAENKMRSLFRWVTVKHDSGV